MYRCRVAFKASCRITRSLDSWQHVALDIDHETHNNERLKAEVDRESAHETDRCNVAICQHL